MKKRIVKKLLGGNPAHLKYVQEARRSNEAGLHGPTKKQEHRNKRRDNKVILKQVLNSEGD